MVLRYLKSWPSYKATFSTFPPAFYHRHPWLREKVFVPFLTITLMVATLAALLTQYITHNFTTALTMAALVGSGGGLAFLFIVRSTLSKEEENFFATLPYILQDFTSLLKQGVSVKQALTTSLNNYGAQHLTTFINQRLNKGQTLAQALYDVSQLWNEDRLRRFFISLSVMIKQGINISTVEQLTNSFINVRTVALKATSARINAAATVFTVITSVLPLFIITLYAFGNTLFHINLSLTLTTVLLLIGVEGVALGVLYTLFLTSPSKYPPLPQLPLHLIVLPWLLASLVALFNAWWALITFVLVLALLIINQLPTLQQVFKAEQQDKEMLSLLISMSAFPSFKDLKTLLTAMAQHARVLNETLSSWINSLDKGATLAKVANEQHGLLALTVQKLQSVERAGRRIEDVGTELVTLALTTELLNKEHAAAISMLKVSALTSFFLLPFAFSLTQNIAHTLSAHFHDVKDVVALTPVVMLYLLSTALLTAFFISKIEQSARAFLIYALALTTLSAVSLLINL